MENGQQDKKEGWERDLLEKLAFASLEETRKARRWSNFFNSWTYGKGSLRPMKTALMAFSAHC